MNKRFCLTILNVFILGRDETMQSVRPSFLEYFEQKEKENQRNNYGRNVPERFSSDWRVPQDGDYEFVSKTVMVCTNITMG